MKWRIWDARFILDYPGRSSTTSQVSSWKRKRDTIHQEEEQQWADPGLDGHSRESRRAAAARSWRTRQPTFPRSLRPSASAPQCGLQSLCLRICERTGCSFWSHTSVVLIYVNIISINMLKKKTRHKNLREFELFWNILYISFLGIWFCGFITDCAVYEANFKAVWILWIWD